MKHNIFIPSKIRVGYNERKDTYSQLLGYIIYYDEKGKLRKENSFTSWVKHGEQRRMNSIEPDETYVPLPIDDYDNEPLSGFVLNKKVGDYRSDWNGRLAWCRVYDPRGFEIEIDIENLLYILENANSIKGKGLEGEFVYGFVGGRLILIPTTSPDYQEIKKYTEDIKNPDKITSKNLIIGATYKTRTNEELIYLGRFIDYKDKSAKKYYFYSEDSWRKFERLSSLSKLVKLVNSECAPNYAELMDELECKTFYSPIDHSRDEYVKSNNPLRYYHSENYIKINDEYIEVIYERSGGWDWQKRDYIYKHYLKDVATQRKVSPDFTTKEELLKYTTYYDKVSKYLMNGREMR